MDHSDGQSREFREGLLLLVASAAATSAVSWAVRRAAEVTLHARPPSTAEDVALLPVSGLVLCWRVVAALGMTWVLLGSGAGLLVAAVTLHWAVSSATLCLSRRCTARSGPGTAVSAVVPVLAAVVVWSAACGIKAVAEIYKWSLGFASLLRPVLSIATSAGVPQGALDAAWSAALRLDRARTGMPWFALYGLVLLRLVSWSTDARWAALAAGAGDGAAASGSDAAGGKGKPSRPGRPHADGPLGHAARVEAHHPLRDYGVHAGGCSPAGCAWTLLRSWLCLVAYALYPPTLVAGPVTTFNAWLSHIKSPQRQHTRPAVGAAVLRAAGLVLALEAALHYFPFFSVAKHGSFRAFGPRAVAIFGYCAIVMLWLKFSAIWATFRAWALLDGVEVPDNMRRCVANNHSVSGFWRAWHRSYNMWLVRYLYVPLGGGKAGPVLRLVNTCLVFLFVALWHDVNPELLIWGGLVGLLFVPEIAANALVGPGGPLAWARGRWWFRFAAAGAAALNIFMMVVPNVVGYTRLGSRGGMAQLLWTLLVVGGDDPSDRGGLPLLLGMFLLIAMAALLMIWVRAGEESRCGAVKEAWRGERSPAGPSQEQLLLTSAIRAGTALLA